MPPTAHLPLPPCASPPGSHQTAGRDAPHSASWSRQTPCGSARPRPAGVNHPRQVSWGRRALTQTSPHCLARCAPAQGLPICNSQALQLLAAADGRKGHPIHHCGRQGSRGGWLLGAGGKRGCVEDGGQQADCCCSRARQAQCTHSLGPSTGPLPASSAATTREETRCRCQPRRGAGSPARCRRRLAGRPP